MERWVWVGQSHLLVVRAVVPEQQAMVVLFHSPLELRGRVPEEPVVHLRFQPGLVVELVGG